VGDDLDDRHFGHHDGDTSAANTAGGFAGEASGQVNGDARGVALFQGRPIALGTVDGAREALAALKELGVFDPPSDTSAPKPENDLAGDAFAAQSAKVWDASSINVSEMRKLERSLLRDPRLLADEEGKRQRRKRAKAKKVPPPPGKLHLSDTLFWGTPICFSTESDSAEIAAILSEKERMRQASERRLMQREENLSRDTFDALDKIERLHVRVYPSCCLLCDGLARSTPALNCDLRALHSDPCSSSVGWKPSS